MGLKLKYSILLSFASLNLSLAQISPYVNLGIAEEFHFKNSFLSNVSVGFKYEKFKYLHFGLEAYSNKFWNNDYSGPGVGLRPVIQIPFLRRTNYSLILDLKGGPIYMLPPHTEGALNFIFFGGTGLETNLFKKHKLQVILGYTHFSNGKMADNTVNPMWDGAGIAFSFIFGPPNE